MGYAARRIIKCLLCDADSIGRKLCRKHYNQMRKERRLDEFPVLSIDDVFDTRYEVKETGCWEWMGAKNSYGYGIFLLPGERPARAHRVMYERRVGPILDGMVIMHICDNPPCVNPDHLKVGTKLDNNRDRIAKRRGKYGLERKNTKLSDQDVLDIRADPRPQVKIAEQYGVAPSHISRIKSGKDRTHV